MQQNATALSGVLIIDKPEGPTSHDVIAHVRRLTKLKTGHAGTLDPFATGVLVVALGSATRLLEYTRDLPKTYLATITLGATSDTDDKTGKVKIFSPPRRGSTAEGGVEVASREQVHKVLQTLIGPIQQIPPAYSAVKVKGKKLYEYAREGVGDSALRKPRPVIIHSIKLLAYHYPKLELEIACGGGTYIRALARDIGEALHTGAYVEELRRTAVGSFDVKNSVVPDKLSTGTLPNHLLPPEKLIEHLPHITLDSANVAKLRKGQAIEVSEKFPAKKPIAIFDENNSLIGIGKYDPTSSLLHPQKVL